jgi:hypothetical protein
VPKTQLSLLSNGDVHVQRHGKGWILAEIGRGKYVKRFNLREEEAMELVRQLVELLGNSG